MSKQISLKEVNKSLEEILLELNSDEFAPDFRDLIEHGSAADRAELRAELEDFGRALYRLNPWIEASSAKSLEGKRDPCPDSEATR